MASYSIRQLTYILGNYWLLRDGVIPTDSDRVMVGLSHRSPFESAACWIADVDTALSKLDQVKPDNWLKIAPAINRPALTRLVHHLGLTPGQKRIIRYFLLNEDKFAGRIGGGLKDMQEILNG